VPVGGVRDVYDEHGRRIQLYNKMKGNNCNFFKDY